MSTVTGQRVSDDHCVEITADMIEAGARVLSLYDIDSETPQEGAVNVFRAMLGAAIPSSSFQQPRLSFRNQ
jgi:hypothetical protein